MIFDCFSIITPKTNTIKTKLTTTLIKIFLIISLTLGNTNALSLSPFNLTPNSPSFYRQIS